jgi:ribosome-binding protein aMBF1 (putative translation factor)
MRKKNIRTLEEFKDKYYGKKGTPKRDKLEKGYNEFKLGSLILDARLEKGLTQEELADKCGTNKAFISKVENNIKDVRLSTLRKIVEVGLEGQLSLSIRV